MVKKKTKWLGGYSTLPAGYSHGEWGWAQKSPEIKGFSMEFQLVGLFCCVGLERGDSSPTHCRGNLGANGSRRPRDPSLVEFMETFAEIVGLQ